MLIKMKESKGFTLVELMIVVAIIGILAAVAVPFYQRYVQKSRLTSQVFPGMHSIETNIGAYFAVSNTWTGIAMTNMVRDADTQCYDPTWTAATKTLRIVVVSVAGGRCPNMTNLNGMTLDAVPQLDVATGTKILSWSLSNSLANELGLK